MGLLVKGTGSERDVPVGNTAPRPTFTPSLVVSPGKIPSDQSLYTPSMVCDKTKTKTKNIPRSHHDSFLGLDPKESDPRLNRGLTDNLGETETLNL